MIIDYELWEGSSSFWLFDIAGKLVRNMELHRGKHNQEIDGYDLNSGVYLFKLVNEDKDMYNGKVVVIK